MRCPEASPECFPAVNCPIEGLIAQLLTNENTLVLLHEAFQLADSPQDIEKIALQAESVQNQIDSITAVKRPFEPCENCLLG